MTAGTGKPGVHRTGSVDWGLAETAGVWIGHLFVPVLWTSALLALFYSGSAPDPIPIPLLAANALAIWAVYLVGPIVVTRVRGNGPVSDLWARMSLGDVPIGLTIGAALQWLALPILYWPILQVFDVDPSEAAQELADSIDGRLDAVLLTLVVVLGAPLAEEFFYRGMLLQAIRRNASDVAAVIGSSVVFALIHIQPILYPGTFLLGVVAAVATLRTGRLGMAFAMHVGFNGATLLTLLVL